MKMILINDIEQAMQGVLNNEQMSQLRMVLECIHPIYPIFH